MATIKVYSTASCMYCNLLKDFLDEKDVEYTAIDIGTDAAAREYVMETSGAMGVPITEIVSEEGESDFIVGFDEQAVTEKLGL